MWNLTFARVGWGKLKWKGQVSRDFFLSGVEVANSERHVLDEMEELKEEIKHLLAIGLQKLFLKACMKSREWLNMNDFGL